MRGAVKLLGMLALALVIAACGDDPPPTQIVIVISPTPESGTPATPEITLAAPTLAPTADTQPTPRTTRQPETTPLPSATPRPDNFPTDVIAPVPLAEQVFEHGRMFWIRDTRQIWVMEAAPDDPNRGDWFCYNDTFEEGEPEIDPALVPPDGMFQPRRGFGKLWRNQAEIREAVGWAITPEFELTSNYRYIHGGTVDGGQYFPGPGEHRLTTLYNETIVFYETDIRGECQGGTWRLGQ